jgi:alpha/beta superfamily hydrolase
VIGPAPAISNEQTQEVDAWRTAGSQSEAIIIDGANHHFAPHLKEANDYIVKTFDTEIGPCG